MNQTRVDVIFQQELDVLLNKSTPYALSSPKFGKRTFHDFIKGLILSTNILEVINNHLPIEYEADWGQVIDEKDGNALSRECDIIIYKGQPLKRINNNYINYVLVGKELVKLVIQVRSSIHSVTKDIKEYCKDLKKFVPKVWFIAECCWAKRKSRENKIKQDLKEAGYDYFIYLYRKDYYSFEVQVNYELFNKFIQLIRRIK